MNTYRSQESTVEAMQVTIESLHDVRKWVGTMLSRDGIKVVIPVPGSRPAQLDEWVVKDGDKFIVLTNEEFTEKYEA